MMMYDPTNQLTPPSPDTPLRACCEPCRGLQWQGAYPFPLTTFPSLRYDSDNFFVMDLEPDGSGAAIVDWAKNKGGARCGGWEFGAGVRCGAVGARPGGWGLAVVAGSPGLGA